MINLFTQIYEERENNFFFHKNNQFFSTMKTMLMMFICLYRAFDKSLMSFFSISFKKYEDIRYDVYGEFIGNLLRFC